MKKELFIILLFIILLIAACEDSSYSYLGIKKTPKLTENGSGETFRIITRTPEDMNMSNNEVVENNNQEEAIKPKP